MSSPRIAIHRPVTKLISSNETAHLLNLAFKCAAAVYEPNSQPRSDGFKFSLREAVKSSATGTVKAASFWDLGVVCDAQNPVIFEKNDHFPAMVIAIRGSASVVDHMVNANGERRDAGFFFVCTLDFPLFTQLAEGKLNRQKKRWDY